MQVARRGIRAITTLAVVAAALAVPGSAHAAAWLAPFGAQTATVTLSPLAGSSETDKEACLTATLRDAGSLPLVNQVARFEVAWANNLTRSLSSDAAGAAILCYVGAIVGTDTITVYADVDGDGTRDAEEPAASAAFTWRAPSVDGQDRDED